MSSSPPDEVLVMKNSNHVPVYYGDPIKAFHKSMIHLMHPIHV